MASAVSAPQHVLSICDPGSSASRAHILNACAQRLSQTMLTMQCATLLIQMMLMLYDMWQILSERVVRWNMTAGSGHLQMYERCCRWPA